MNEIRYVLKAQVTNNQFSGTQCQQIGPFPLKIIKNFKFLKKLDLLHVRNSFLPSLIFFVKISGLARTVVSTARTGTTGVK